MFEVMKDKDIFESKCQALVCPVNTQGVMGKGLALEFKKRFPAYFWDYHDWCENRHARHGDCHLYINKPELQPRYLISVATKDHWQDPSDLRWIETGLINLRELIEKQNIKSIAVPALGCGLGGLPWGPVYQLTQKHLGNLKNTHVRLYPPQ